MGRLNCFRPAVSFRSKCAVDKFVLDFSRLDLYIKSTSANGIERPSGLELHFYTVCHHQCQVVTVKNSCIAFSKKQRSVTRGLYLVCQDASQYSKHPISAAGLDTGCGRGVFGNEHFAGVRRLAVWLWWKRP